MYVTSYRVAKFYQVTCTEVEMTHWVVVSFSWLISADYHSDDETDLVVDSTIASLSLGQTRNFMLKAKREIPGEGEIKVALYNGDLLCMRYLVFVTRLTYAEEELKRFIDMLYPRMLLALELESI
jgi:hypothetical protein